MLIERQSMDLLAGALEKLEQGLDSLPDFTAQLDLTEINNVIQLVAERMQDNYPYAHPLYAGQMLKPPHPMARLAYTLALFINPNNHALDGGRASSAMEKEVIADLAEMFGWGIKHLGHLTSGGTMANMEALWIADQLHPGKIIVASEQAHYTHSRLTSVLKIPYQSVDIDSYGRMSIAALESLCQQHQVGTVVVTLSTTGMGAVDPLPEILALQKTYGFRIHIDAAYGGYFRLVDNLPTSASAAFNCVSQADSIVIDPHKCGLQPYGCGCILFRDPDVGRFYKHDSPYTYFSSDELHLGEISLECSRAGASAVALWATMKLLPLTADGEFAGQLKASMEAARKFHQRLTKSANDLTIIEPETNIVIWAPKGSTASQISHLSQAIFEAAAELNLHLATIRLPSNWLSRHWSNVDFDQDSVVCLRSCLMKAEHLDWLEQIWTLYRQSADSIR